MLILIDGYLATGKTTLRCLLDGYPGFFLSPVQDALIGGFSQYGKIPELLAERDSLGLRRLLVKHSNFYVLEEYAWRKIVKYHASVNAIADFDFEFDFESYEAECFKRFRHLSNWSVESLLRIFYETMPKHWNNNVYINHPITTYVMWDMHHINTPSFLLNNVSDVKILSMSRPPEDIIATRLGRKPVSGNFRSRYRNKLTLESQLSSGELQAIAARQKHLKGLSIEYPRQVHIVDFGELLKNTETTMRQICRFLEIDFHDCLSDFTFNGCKPNLPSGISFLGEVHDTAEKLLTKSEQKLVQLELSESPLISSILKEPTGAASLLKIRLRRRIRSLRSAIRRNEAL